MLSEPSKITTVPLPPENHRVPRAQRLAAMGWGEFQSQILPDRLQHSTRLEVVRMCNGSDAWNGQIQETMLCAFGLGNGQDTCQGKCVLILVI